MSDSVPNKFGPFKDVNGPILITKIEADTDPNVLVIINITGSFEGKAPPTEDNVRRSLFNFTNTDLAKAKENKPSEDTGMTVPEMFSGSIDMLWNHDLDMLTIVNLPGVSLRSFANPLPEVGEVMQWERADLDLLITIVDGIYSPIRH